MVVKLESRSKILKEGSAPRESDVIKGYVFRLSSSVEFSARDFVEFKKGDLYVCHLEDDIYIVYAVNSIEEDDKFVMNHTSILRSLSDVVGINDNDVSDTVGFVFNKQADGSFDLYDLDKIKKVYGSKVSVTVEEAIRDYFKAFQNMTHKQAAEVIRDLAIKYRFKVKEDPTTSYWTGYSKKESPQEFSSYRSKLKSLRLRWGYLIESIKEDLGVDGSWSVDNKPGKYSESSESTVMTYTSPDRSFKLIVKTWTSRNEPYDKCSVWVETLK